jgi:serine/threonine protein kinase
MERLSFADYELKRRLGRGGFGTVFLAQHISTQQIVAVSHFLCHLPLTTFFFR